MAVNQRAFLLGLRPCDHAPMGPKNLRQQLEAALRGVGLDVRAGMRRAAERGRARKDRR